MTRSPVNLGNLLDTLIVVGARRSARTYGRRSLLAGLGGILVGSAAVAALPFDRSEAAEPEKKADPQDDTTCDYWRYCSLDGTLCTTAGATVSTCPVGSEASQVSWVGTCHNPADQRDYLISYNDCCGKASYAGAQFCLQSKGERPAYSMGLHNDINWCMANTSTGYHCTVAIVMGVAD